MAWVTPVTDRPNDDTYTTYKDMNRIAGNLNYLLGTNIKANYTEDDIVSMTQWNRIINSTKQLNHFGLKITSLTDYRNLNNIEKVALYNSIATPLTLSFTLSKSLGGGRL